MSCRVRFRSGSALPSPHATGRFLTLIVARSHLDRRAAEALTATTAGEEVVPASEHRALQQQVRELHRLLGKKTLDVEILKEVLDQAEPKKRLLLRSSSLGLGGSR
jgi:hypothetical protein